MGTSQQLDSFRGLLLRHRGRTRLTQRQLADRLGLNRRSVQDWETGINYPSAERLQALIRELLEAGGLTTGHEAAEAEALWAAAERDAPRMRTPFDHMWFARLLAERTGGPDSAASPPASTTGDAAEPGHDWGDAPGVRDFVGRTEELRTMRHWVLDEGCRLVGVLGMGGMGKTRLAAKLAQEVAPSFDRIYWRSLRDAPPTSEWLAGAIGFLSDQRLVPPAAESERLVAMLQLLRERRCLLVLDNFETVYEPGQREVRHRAGLAGYSRLLQVVGEARHGSCVVLTSREAPPELAVLGGRAVRTLSLTGLDEDEARALLGPKQLSGTREQWAELITRYAGNGLALKIVGESIRELFHSDIDTFLDQAGDEVIFGGIRRLLSEQVERSSAPERWLLQLMAVEREPLRLKELLAAVGLSLGHGTVLDAVEGLRGRSLVEVAAAPGAPAFMLQSVVLEYVTDRLVEEVADEIAHGQPARLLELPLIKAQANDYVRQSQERLIGEPILQSLESYLGEAGTEQQLLALLEGWRDQPAVEQGKPGGAQRNVGFGPGNVVNLLRLLHGHLRGLDLSRLSIRQAYLAGIEGQDASLAGAHLDESVLAESFDPPNSVGLSADGAWLAAGTSTGKVHLWRVVDRTPMLVLRGHTSAVWGVALSADGACLASGSQDGTVRAWSLADVRGGEETMLGTHASVVPPSAGLVQIEPSGRLLATFRGHTGAVYGVALSSDGRLLASSSADGTVKLWDVASGKLLTTLVGHGGAVRGLALNANGGLLASGSVDGTIKLWEVPSGRPLATLQGHTSGVLSVALSWDGRLLASGGEDGSVRMWETPFPDGDARLLAILQAYTGGVWAIALSANGELLASGSLDGPINIWTLPSGTSGRLLVALHGHTTGSLALTASGELLASGGEDGSVRLWQVSSGRPLAALWGNTGGVWCVALSGNGARLASGSQDGVVRVWDTSSGQLLSSMRDHARAIRAVALSANGDLLASGSLDGSIKLTEVPSGRLLADVPAHSGGVFALVLSADERLLISGSLDGTLKLWEVSSGRLLATLPGHDRGIWGLALSGDGELLVSGGFEGTIKVWEVSTRRLLAVWQGHASVVCGVVLSNDGRLLVTSGLEGTIKLWETASWRLLVTLEGHAGVPGLALSADAKLLASCSLDGTVKLREIPSGQLLATLLGHTGGVYGVALSADGGLVVSGSFDGTVRLWDARTGTTLRTLRSDRRYERMDITGLTGITEAQRLALGALGAVERS